MISSQALRQMAEAGLHRILINSSGELSEVAGVPDDALVPSLVVGEVNEAVKHMESGMVVHYLNRDALWAVEGFLLDRKVVSSLPDGVESAAELIEAVTRAGYQWHAVLL